MCAMQRTLMRLGLRSAVSLKMSEEAVTEREELSSRVLLSPRPRTWLPPSCQRMRGAGRAGPDTQVRLTRAPGEYSACSPASRGGPPGRSAQER